MNNLNKLLQKQFNEMQKAGKLFVSEFDGNKMWDTYIESFDNDPVFRDPESSLHNCNHCKNFIRRYSNIVSLDSNINIITMFDIELPETSEYYIPVKKMREALKSHQIKEVFIETFDVLHKLPYEPTNKNMSVFKLGTDLNTKKYNKEEAEKFGVVKEGEVKTFHHMMVSISSDFIDSSGRSSESIQATYRDNKQVFKRGLDEIPMDTLLLVRDLINQGSLLNGNTYLDKLNKFIQYKKEYDNILDNKKDNWTWVNSQNNYIAKFRNELIGVLCVELAEGVEINKACKDWNYRIDPINYMKAVAPITKKQKEEAEKFVIDNGYLESFDRRFANIDDINASEIKYSDVGDGIIKDITIFDNLKTKEGTRHKKSQFDKVEEVSIDKFVKDILPGCNSVELFLENKHENNLITLTTSKHKNSKNIFAWGNNFSWTFKGNIAGKSLIKDAVKSRGGRTDVPIRISMSFPNTTDDYDLHVLEPNGNKIFYPNLREQSPNGGMLDLDAQGLDGHQPADRRVENVVYANLNSMKNGDYKVMVNNYSGRGLMTPFLLEIEINGEVTLLESDPLKNNFIDCVLITKNRDNVELKVYEDNMTIIESQTLSKEIWGVETNKFHQIELISTTPNHWGEDKVGNKHYIFGIKGCKPNEPIRSFHAENLKSDLKQHRKVIDVLGNTTMIEPTSKEKALSGVGFNSTIRDEVILKLSGSHKRMVKVKF